ncbi:eukaryotic translation initiation factor 4B1-like [Curcuma longa]|uniref:eukaryotic translation initiation factor 4B1-like n=1 Tax=Curcuma longa TaxID=136217 RepID=UPI003D9DDC5A
MSNPWGGVGAWALDAEREEAEVREREAVAGNLAQSFPSLKESASSASTKQKKKKKNAAIPLAQFVATGGASAALVESSKGLTPEEMLRLPTGPRERSQDELEHGRLGGGFRSFGAGERDGAWGGGRRGYSGFDEGRRGPPPRDRDLDLQSRADEVDSWGAGKKAFVPLRSDGGRRDPYGFGDGSSSKADDVDNWASMKKPLPSKSSSFGSEFRDPRTSSDSNRWGRDIEGSIPREIGRRRLVLDPPKKRDVDAPPPTSEPVKTRPSPFGAARPREEVLAEKGMDWKQMNSEYEMNTSRPTSSHSSRPSSSQSSRQGSLSLEEVVIKSKPKVNPFGNAKPREVILEEKGVDWKKVDLDLEHTRVERSETNEERLLKEEINHLKSLAIETDGGSKLPVEQLSMLHNEIASKEKDLELLACRLDDTVRFGQRYPTTNSRPGSAAGRSDTSSTRSASQSGMSERSRSTEFVDRPQSRGAAGDEGGQMANNRRGFQRGSDKGFFHGRNSERSSSRERW